jgi:secreted Zn-dependent insulinase-like peptidase
LTALAEPGLPEIDVSLPPQNPFVPKNLEIKSLPEADADHILLNASLKLCIQSRKKKHWFPGTVTRYHRKNNAVLVSFDGEEEVWHTLDQKPSKLSHEVLAERDFEGTMDSKSIKYRIVGLSMPGNANAGTVLGDESMGPNGITNFPPIPPPLSASRLPKEISNTNSLKMWWLQDRTFRRPIAEFRLQVVSAKANASPLHRTCCDLLRDLCADALIETSYLAEMCELCSAIETAEIGFYLRFHGYDANLLELFETWMKTLLSFRGCTDSLPDTVTNERFAACSELLQRAYNNAHMRAAGLSSHVRLRALRPTIWPTHKKQHVLESLTIGEFARTVSAVLEQVAVEALIHGNVTREDADKAKNMVLRLLDADKPGTGLSRKNYPAQSVLRIPRVDGISQIVVPSKDPAEPNTACEVYIQIGKDNLRDRVLNDLLLHILDEPFYDQVRTKDQFGYDVASDIRWTYGILGCWFRVTTCARSATDVVNRIDRFLTDVRKELVDMTQEDFHEYKVGLAQQKLDAFHSLSDETGHLWAEIRDGRFEWESWRNEAVCLRNLEKKDVLAAFDAWIRPGQRRPILAVQVIGGNGNSEAAEGRPAVDADGFGDYVDEQIKEFHKSCKKQTWGRVNSKLF